MPDKEDCDYCHIYRDKGTNFCAMCGKPLKDTVLSVEYRSIIEGLDKIAAIGCEERKPARYGEVCGQ